MNDSTVFIKYINNLVNQMLDQNRSQYREKEASQVEVSLNNQRFAFCGLRFWKEQYDQSACKSDADQ
jgi:hypothetical protein